MGLREDTVVSQLPDFADDESTRVERGTSPQVRAGRAIAGLDQSRPQMPPRWGSAAAPLRVVPPQPPRAPATRARPPIPPPPGLNAAPRVQPQPGLDAAPRVQPIPKMELEPSVVETIPQPPRTPQPAAEAAAGAGGQVMVMFSCRGGSGATTLAVNTAAALVRRGKKVCVVDLDLQLGDVFVALDLEPTTSIAALAREASTIDAAALRRRLARHDSGLFALGQTGAVDDVDDQLAERLPALLSTLCDHFDYVIVDGVRDFGDCALAVLDMADQISMVVTQDVASVRRAGRAVELFRRLGYSESKMRLVLNRCARRAPVGADEIRRALGLEVTARVRNDFRRVHAAINDGALLGDVARGKGVARDIEQTAEALAGLPAPGGAGLLSRLFKKGGN